MKLKLAIVVLLIGALLVAGFLYLHHKKNVVADVNAPSPQDLNAEIQQQGEMRYKQKLYAPLIETYRRLLEKMPDNIDLKKKLAFAYFGATEYDKALPLLKEVTDAGMADDEVRREMKIIGKNQER